MSLEQYLDIEMKQVVESIVRDYQKETKKVDKREFLNTILNICVSRNKTVFELSDLIDMIWHRIKKRNTIFTVIYKLYKYNKKYRFMYIYDDVSKKNYIFNNYRKAVRINIEKLKLIIKKLEQEKKTKKKH